MSHSSRRKTRKFDYLKHDWFHLARNTVIAILLTFLALNIIVGVSRVDGQSMDPTLKDNQVVFYLRLGDSFKRGDLVAIKMPNGEKYVKRIIGVPGDVINLKEGFVYLNGKRVTEDFIKNGDGTTEPENERIEYPYKINNDCFWVMGDNRYESMDSRQFGPIIIDNIKGRLLFNN